MSAASDRRIVVDGETFTVSASESVTRFVWESGPHPGYGFSVSAGGRGVCDVDALERLARSFLAQIDPKTGYLGDS